MVLVGDLDWGDFVLPDGCSCCLSSGGSVTLTDLMVDSESSRSTVGLGVVVVLVVVLVVVVVVVVVGLDSSGAAKLLPSLLASFGGLRVVLVELGWILLICTDGTRGIGGSSATCRLGLDVEVVVEVEVEVVLLGVGSFFGRLLDGRPDARWGGRVVDVVVEVVVVVDVELTGSTWTTLGGGRRTGWALAGRGRTLAPPADDDDERSMLARCLSRSGTGALVDFSSRRLWYSS